MKFLCALVMASSVVLAGDYEQHVDIPFNGGVFNFLLATNEHTEIQGFPNAGVITFLGGTSAFYGPPGGGTFQGFAGVNPWTVVFTSNGNAFATASIFFHIQPEPPPPITPIASLSSSPSVLFTGEALSLTAGCNLAASFLFDYGDGTSGSDPTHSYSSPGVFTIKVTASTSNGVAFATASVKVLSPSSVPKARIQTSEIVAFVNTPLTFDGSSSTDPENQTLSFSWNFGDGSPAGSGSVISKVYTLEGTRTVTLTITDSDGLSNSSTLEIEVLSEESASTFDSEITVSSTYYPLKTNKDVVTVFARVNVGDTKLVDGSAIAIEYAGKRYSANLNKRLKAPGWTIKQNLRRQPFGTVEVAFKARNTSIASLLTSLGAADGVEIDVPFRLELGLKTIQVNVPTAFEATTSRGKGLGEF